MTLKLSKMECTAQASLWFGVNLHDQADPDQVADAGG